MRRSDRKRKRRTHPSERLVPGVRREHTFAAGSSLYPPRIADPKTILLGKGPCPITIDGRWPGR